MSDIHWENITKLDDWGESSGTGPWIKLLMAVRDMPAWRGLKGSVYTVTCCALRDNGEEYELDQSNVWRNDAQQVGFGESDSKGGWVKFRVEPKDLAFFRGQKDEPFYWKFIMMEKVEKVVKRKAKAKANKGEFSHEVRDLHQHGFFKNPKLWEIVGTDKQYQAWTRKRPCVVSGEFDYDTTKGEERTEFAHVRRAGDSGTGYKAEFSGVPLTHEIHANYQHQHGETKAYAFYLDRRGKRDGVISEVAAKEWFNKKALENVEKWAHEMTLFSINQALAKAGQPVVDSLTKIKPKTLHWWAEKHGLHAYLPRCYKENL